MMNKMNKTFRAIAAAALAAVVTLAAAGCGSLMSSLNTATMLDSDIDKWVTVAYPDNTYTWAEGIAEQAKIAGNKAGTTKRQVTKQQTQWVSTGAEDYQFNQAELKVGIAQGKYKLGESIVHASGWDSIGRYHDGIWYAYDVMIPKQVNVTSTVSDVDKTLYQQAYNQKYKEWQDWIVNAMQYANEPYVESTATALEKKVAKRLEERFYGGRPLPSGTLLVYSNVGTNPITLVAFLNDTGAFVCRRKK